MIINFKKFENYLDPSDKTPDLIVAVKCDNINKVKKLLNDGYDVNCHDSMDWSPLLWAVYYKNIKMIRILINAGANITHKAIHHIRGTKKMVDFYDLCVDKEYYDGGYKRIINWINDNYPEFVKAKKYNIL